LAVRTREITCSHDGIDCAGLLAWDADAGLPRPGVLVAHTIRGRTAFEEDRARALAATGYVALAIDLYGLDSRHDSIDDLRTRMNAYLSDRGRLKHRLLDWFEMLRSADEVADAQTAAIGFCFGGLCALDLARSGVDIGGVASFHGLLTPPPGGEHDRIAAKVLVLHGWDDPLAPPDDVIALASELTARGADWQLHAYGHTQHAFTNPQADDTSAGTVYNAAADRRSYAAMQSFLAEVFAIRT
jgi:dienelactone hydrolase